MEKRQRIKLKEAGINTIKDIADYSNYDILRQIVGKNALLLYRKANGIDSRMVDPQQNELKSVGNSTTLLYDTYDEVILYDTLKKLAKKVSLRAKNRNLISNSISITIKYTRFESVTRQTTINSYINDYEIILSTTKMLFDSNYNGRAVRLLGVSLNNTINQKDYKEQLSIFDSDQNNTNKTDELDIILDDINKKLKKPILIKASKIKKKSIQKKYLK